MVDEVFTQSETTDELELSRHVSTDEGEDEVLQSIAVNVASNQELSVDEDLFSDEDDWLI